MRATTVAANSGRHRQPRERQQMDLFDASSKVDSAPLWPELPKRAYAISGFMKHSISVSLKPAAAQPITSLVDNGFLAFVRDVDTLPQGLEYKNPC